MTSQFTKITTNLNSLISRPETSPFLSRNLRNNGFLMQNLETLKKLRKLLLRKSSMFLKDLSHWTSKELSNSCKPTLNQKRKSKAKYC